MSHNPIFAIADRANELRATGVDVITLVAGEADAPTSAHIVDAAIRAAADPANHHYGSASGLGSLRDAIARAPYCQHHPALVGRGRAHHVGRQARTGSSV